MIKFLTTTGISYRIDEMIKSAKDWIILASPYLQLTESFKQKLRKDLPRGIKVIYREDNKGEVNFFKQLKNCKVYKLWNLHAKCYLNENVIIVASMNLYNYSQQNNREMGFEIIKDEEDKELYEEIYNEIMDYINISVECTNESEIKIVSEKAILSDAERKAIFGANELESIFNSELKTHSKRTIVSSADELESIFRPEIKSGVIPDKLKMPVPGGEGIIIRVLYTKTKDGTMGIIDRVENPKFKGGVADFLTVEKYNDTKGVWTGIEQKIFISESIKNSFRRLMNSERWEVVDIPGKPVYITASYWKTAPMKNRDPKVKCIFCSGTGCKTCNMSGLQSPVVFNIQKYIGIIAKQQKEDF